MTVKDIIDRLENGATKLVIYEPNNGELLFAGIWLNEIEKTVFDYSVTKITVKDYFMRLEVEQ